MNFDENNRAIYLQIADRICDDIANGIYSENDRLPSVREMAASVQVNANTVMRTYERLQQQELIVNRRGIGFFVAAGARKAIIDARSRRLLDTQLDSIFALLHQSGMTPEELAGRYRTFIVNNQSSQS